LASPTGGATTRTRWPAARQRGTAARQAFSEAASFSAHMVSDCQIHGGSERSALNFVAVCVETHTLHGDDVRGVGEEATLDRVHVVQMAAGMHGRVRVAQRGDKRWRTDEFVIVLERAARVIADRHRQNVVNDVRQPALDFEIALDDRVARLDRFREDFAGVSALSCVGRPRLRRLR
jgi:hypothetical protein